MAYDRYEDLDTFKLVFEEFPGLTIRVRRANFAGLLATAEAMPVLRRSVARRAGLNDVANLRAWRKLCVALGDALVSWDLRNGAEPVPATARGLMAQDFGFVMTVAHAWSQATSRPSVATPAPAEMPAPEPAGLELDEEWLSQLPVVVAENQPLLKVVE